MSERSSFQPYSITTTAYCQSKMSRPQRLNRNLHPEFSSVLDSLGENDSDGDDGSLESTTSTSHGSTLTGAIFNFTNSIIGAGCIGLGGAIAISGGLVSVVLILFFAVLTKISLDLVVRLSVEVPGAKGSYEDLAFQGMGNIGKTVVMACKFLYSFGCLIAYIIVVKDNFGSSISNLLGGIIPLLRNLDHSAGLTTWALSTTVILPLCLLRDMTPLSKFSLVSVVSMAGIVGIVVFIYFAHPEVRTPGGTTYQNWFEIRSGVLESLGTFVFTFVSQHTVHLVFGSLQADVRDIKHWKIVSTTAISVASAVSLTVGVVVYMTFWDETKSDIFAIYPNSWEIDLAKLLLCVTMLLTFPLPFFTCRELLVILCIHPFCDRPDDDDDVLENLEEPLLAADHHAPPPATTTTTSPSDAMSISTELSRMILETSSPKNWLLPEDDRQLRLLGHVALTVKLWVVTTGLAIAAPSLGDVLDLVGCATGTVIAFVIPGLLSLKLEGMGVINMCILSVGGLVGLFGTYFSIKKLFADI